MEFLCWLSIKYSNMMWSTTFREIISYELLIPPWDGRLIETINWPWSSLETCNNIQYIIIKGIHLTKVQHDIFLKNGVVRSFLPISKDQRTLSPSWKVLLQNHMGLINYIMIITYLLLISLVRFIYK